MAPEELFDSSLTAGTDLSFVYAVGLSAYWGQFGSLKSTAQPKFEVRGWVGEIK